MPENLDFTLPPFLVHIIESNQVSEIQQRFCEGDALKKVLQFSNIQVDFYTSVDASNFDLQIRRMSASAQKTSLFPILHISAHGSTHGIHLTTGDTISWRYLTDLLEPLRQFSGGNYLLCVSACEGLNALQVALQTPDFPVFGVVGPSQVIDWPDNVVGFAAFYHLLQKGKTIRQAVDGMRVAAGNDTFEFIHGPALVNTAKFVHNSWNT